MGVPEPPSQFRYEVEGLSQSEKLNLGNCPQPPREMAKTKIPIEKPE